MTIAVDLGRKATKQTNKHTFNVSILLRFGKNEHQYVSKTYFKLYVKMINNVRATFYQIEYPMIL